MHSILENLLNKKDFFNRIVPEKYRTGKYISDRGRILVNDEYITPNDILRNDPLFRSLRVKI